MRYFCDYEEAKGEAKKRGLIECEYGDTGYMSIYGVIYIRYAPPYYGAGRWPGGS